MVRVLLVGSAVWAAMAVGVASIWAADPGRAPHVEISTTSGQTLSGLVDSRTDEHRLWLRKTADNIVLSSSVAWDDVESARLDGEAVSTDTLEQRRDNLATDAPRLSFATPADSPPVDLQPTAPQASTRTNARMRNVEIVDACLVNLNRDVEPDGLQIAIVAVSEDGQPMPVAGSLSAELLVERRPWRISEVDFGPLDRWNQPVRPTDFVDGVATYLLPFRHAAPQWQFDVLPDAILTVRLGAFGQGNYGASSPVIIRRLDPLRDDRQLLDETRFLPGEMRGRNPHNRLRPENGLWLHWTR